MPPAPAAPPPPPPGAIPPPPGGAPAADGASSEELEAALLEDDGLNVRLGAAHLRWLIDHRGEWDDEAVLVSYNAGRVRLFRWIERDGSYEAWARGEEARARRGERTTGALAYARQVQRVRDLFRARWRP